MAAPRRFMFFFCGRGKVGGRKYRLLCDESFESCLAEQRFSVPCVTFRIVLSIVRPLGVSIIVRISLALNLRLCVKN